MEQSFIVNGIVKRYKVEKQFGNFAKLTNHLALSSTSPLLSTREVKTYADQRVVQYLLLTESFVQNNLPLAPTWPIHTGVIFYYSVYYYTTVFRYWAIHGRWKTHEYM